MGDKQVLNLKSLCDSLYNVVYLYKNQKDMMHGDFSPHSACNYKKMNAVFQVIQI